MSENLKKGWTRVAFGDVVERVDETGVPTSEESRTYIGLEHLDADSLTVTNWGSEVDLVVPKTRIKKGDVLFARRNTHLKRCAIAPFDTYFSPDGYAFRSMSPILQQDLLIYIVASDGFMNYAIEHSAGTHSKRVKWDDLVRYKFALPPQEEQRRIAEVLMAVNATRVSHQQVRDAAWSMRISAYSALTHQGVKDAPLKETHYGPAPCHWSEVPIGDALVIENHLRLPISAAERATMPGPYGYYGPTGRIDSINEYRLDGTFALIGEDGDHFLKHKVWSMTQLVTGKFNVNNHAHVLKGTDQCLVEWFFHFFRHRNVSEWLTKQGAARLKLKKSTLENIPILLPPLAEQREIVHHIEKVSAGTDAAEVRAHSSAILVQNMGNRLLGVL